jgi:DeoR/GlpR family transcriptional regulator of sugar metabolism
MTKYVSTRNKKSALYAHEAIIRGLSEDGILTDISPEENNVRKKMIRHAKRTYLLCTGDKIGKSYFHNLCHKSEITDVIHE